jgi:hypothetical protein
LGAVPPEGEASQVASDVLQPLGQACIRGLTVGGEGRIRSGNAAFVPRLAYARVGLVTVSCRAAAGRSRVAGPGVAVQSCSVAHCLKDRHPTSG